MAIYTTFFVLSASALISTFPGWKPPLSQPETRTVTDFFGTRTIQTRAPEFEHPAKSSPIEPKVIAIKGNFEDYLESRLPDEVAKCPHWAAKNLTPVELNPLGIVIDGKPALQEVLYGPPPDHGMIYEFRREVLRALIASPDDAAKKWAAEMSKPEHTHSQTGIRISPDWSYDDALQIIQRLIALIPKPPAEPQLYLLIEGG